MYTKQRKAVKSASAVPMVAAAAKITILPVVAVDVSRTVSVTAIIVKYK